MTLKQISPLFGILLLLSGCRDFGFRAKAKSEAVCPTDIRQMVPWSGGEDAVFHCPCGPTGPTYGSRPTCWREWPIPATEWREMYCGAIGENCRPLTDHGYRLPYSGEVVPALPEALPKEPILEAPQPLPHSAAIPFAGVQNEDVIWLDSYLTNAQAVSNISVSNTTDKQGATSAHETTSTEVRPGVALAQVQHPPTRRTEPDRPAQSPMQHDSASPGQPRAVASNPFEKWLQR